MRNISSDYIKHRCTYEGTFFSGAKIMASSMAFSAATAGIGALCLPATAVAAGGVLAVMGASAVGGTILWGIPTFLNRFMQDEILLDKDLNGLHKAAFFGIALLAATVGAFMVDVSIMPVLTCACLGLILTALVDLSLSIIGNHVDGTNASSYSA